MIKLDFGILMWLDPRRCRGLKVCGGHSPPYLSGRGRLAQYVRARSRSKRQGGFTLVEALAASLILAAGAVAIFALSNRCMIHNLRGMEYEQAYRLLDECLDECVAKGVESIAATKTITGDFSDRYRDYRYEIQIEPTDLDNLFEVTAVVSWQVMKESYQVSAMTLLYGN